MALLIIGICLWAAIHLIPTLAPGLKTTWKSKLGEGGYMGTFALLVVGALTLTVLGWRSVQPAMVYLPAELMRLPALGLMAVAFVLFTASKRETRIRRLIRHPQLTSVLVWSTAHLLTNGDNRSLVLFGGFAAWSVLEMILISRREGIWIKTPAPGWRGARRHFSPGEPSRRRI